MKKILLSLALVMSSQLFASSILKGSVLQGEIILKGEAKSVLLKTGLLDSEFEIKVGEENFKYSGGSSNNIEGYLSLKQNGEKIKDKNIQIILGQEQIEEIKANISDLSGILANGSEIKCVEESNAFIMISDNISMDMIGNCAYLR